MREKNWYLVGAGYGGIMAGVFSILVSIASPEPVLNLLEAIYCILIGIFLWFAGSRSKKEG